MEADYHTPVLISGIAPGLRTVFDVSALVLLLVCSALISGCEAAIRCLRKEDRLALRAARNRNSVRLASMLEKTERLRSSVMLFNNLLSLAIIIISIITALRLVSPSDSLTGFIAVSASFTFLLVIARTLMARLVFHGSSLTLLEYMSLPLKGIVTVLGPLTSMVLLLNPLTLKGRPGNTNEESRMKSADDEKLLKGIANFGNTSVSEIMVPRIDVTALDIRLSFDRIIPVIINSGFSRIPVYSGSFDTVKGILYAKDVLPYAGSPAGFKWQSLLRTSYFVPETKKINDLLREFQVRKIHMAVVIDEYGGTSGIVTLEDILEEIVGEITDESDEDESLFRKIDNGSYIFAGKILLQEFCDVLGIDEEIFSEVRGESETLAGLMLELAGEIPQKDQVLSFNDFIFRIESVDRRRIREVRVELNKKDEEPVS